MKFYRFHFTKVFEEPGQAVLISDKIAYCDNIEGMRQKMHGWDNSLGQRGAIYRYYESAAQKIMNVSSNKNLIDVEDIPSLEFIHFFCSPSFRGCLAMELQRRQYP